MSIASTTEVERLAPGEEFPLTSLRHVEARLSKVRQVIMKVAAQLAAEASENHRGYRVKTSHVDQAVRQVFANSKYESDIGV